MYKILLKIPVRMLQYLLLIGLKLTGSLIGFLLSIVCICFHLNPVPPCKGINPQMAQFCNFCAHALPRMLQISPFCKPT